MATSTTVLLAAAAALLLEGVSAFSPPRSSPPASTRGAPSSNAILRSAAADDNADDPDDGMLRAALPTTLGSNWMQRSPSVELQGLTGDESLYMDVGIDGDTFGTAALSRRMHEALMQVAASKFPSGIPDDLVEVYLLYAMDATAKEAVRVAMDSNGYTLNLEGEAMQDEGAWGQVDAVALLDPTTGKTTTGEDGAESYASFMEAIANGGWEPGEGYSFVVREVPARKKAMDLEALLRAIDPDGTLWDEAKAQGILMPGEEVGSLKELAAECDQRVNAAPREATDEEGAYRGGTSKGYNVISRKALLAENRSADGAEDPKTLLHVMDALANHGCLVVDLTDGDEEPEEANAMAGMWDATAAFFDAVTSEEAADLPPMQVAEGVGSSHAVVGFASFKDGDNQFLETRLRRADGALLPEETTAIIGEDGARSMVDAFHIMASVGKDIVRIATAASSAEANAFVTEGSTIVSGDDDGAPSLAGLSFEEASVSGLADDDGPSDEDVRRGAIAASEAATLLTEEIVDDGRPLRNAEIEHGEGPVSMSPHRMCRYSNDNDSKAAASEIFGAHTDTSFVTIVPAAEVSGLEVFDEDALQWYRPELRARTHAKSLDPKMDKPFPWHSRYLVVMPGELLQLTTRNNVPAAVHRVVAATDRPRLSAPVLLRARPGTTMDVDRYLGRMGGADGLLKESDGVKMEEIHDALQPAPKQ
ncbi:hypothetical protein ACHAXT_000318 [Thalassiosira profunda]